MVVDYHQEGGKKKYVDNAYNRRLGRVGKSYGQSKKKSSSNGSKSRKLNNTKTKKKYNLLFSVNILLLREKNDLGIKISSLDKKDHPNKKLQKYIDFKTIIMWYKNQLKDFGKYISTDDLDVVIDEVKKLNNAVMSVKITVEYDTPPLNSDEKTKIEEDIKFIGQSIETVDDSGNYPIKIKDRNVLIGAKLMSFNEDKPLSKKQISRRITPSDLVYPKNDKLVKKTKVKGSGYVKRLSAGAYYRKHKHSDKILGHICKIREKDTTLRCLLKRSNGTVYWAKKSKSGKGQEQCGDWTLNCKESIDVLNR